MKEKTLEFGKLTFHDNYVLAVINEGVNIGSNENDIIIEAAEAHFSKPFTYITHRVNSYSVDPSIYSKAAKLENLSGFAVVSKGYMAKTNAQIERLFFNKPFEIFSTLDEAIEWTKTVLHV